MWGVRSRKQATIGDYRGYWNGFCSPQRMNLTKKTSVMKHKITTLLFSLLLATAPLCAQQDLRLPQYALTYTTEGLWNTTTGVANWVNLLNVDYEFALWQGGSFNLDLLAVGNLRQSQGKSGVADNLHLFSAIEDSPSTLALMAFGIEQRIADERLLLYFGIRNLGKDYFTSPHNSVFTSAMNGLFPSIATNFAVADAPLAAMALHAEWHPSDNWSAKLSIYDGVATQLWNELFCVNLRRDGVFAIGEVGYAGKRGSYVGTYNIGATYGYAPTAQEIERNGTRKSSRASVWVLAEQPIYRQAQGRELYLVLHGAWAPQSDCDLYGAGALVCSSLFAKSDYLGFMMSRGLYRGGYETQLEFTYSYSWRYLKLQPALHRVFTSHRDYTVAMMKIVVEI